MNTLTIVILLAILVFLFIVAYYFNMKNSIKSQNTSRPHQCGLTCTSLDPLMDPAYNMKLVIENSLLLEDHMSNDKRYCIDCCVKHFLLIISYAEEAVWLAGSKVTQYPKLLESVTFYNDLFNHWLDRKEDKEVRLQVLEKLRAHRKELVQIYIVNKEKLKSI
jgi:hypothetical protein